MFKNDGQDFMVKKNSLRLWHCVICHSESRVSVIYCRTGYTRRQPHIKTNWNYFLFACTVYKDQVFFLKFLNNDKKNPN